MAELHSIHIAGGALHRGFWLYVWDIRLRDGRQFLYVGRTGDSSSLYAQSPFGRLSQHLGRNVHSNTLLRHLEREGVSLDDCVTLEMIAYGPIRPEACNDKPEHECNRDHVAALEKQLCAALDKANYTVLNTVHSNKLLHDADWREVAAAFAKTFERLQLD